MFDKLANEAHLWVVRPEAISNDAALAACLAVLSEQEKARYRRFRVAAVRHRFLVSHALVRYVLSKYATLSADEWVFSQSGNGRPEVANPGLSHIRFNLSHTEGLAVCLITSVRDCGVDVEKIHQRHDPMGVAKRMFSPSEYEQMRHLHGRERQQYFFRRWTLREAYTKARGIGITFPTHRLNFDVRTENDIGFETEPSVDDDQDRWQFELFSLTGVHIAAAAIKRADRHDITIIRHNIDDDFGDDII